MSATVSVAAAHLGVSPRALFAIARRVNPKRSVLFVSTVLGKHLPVDPAVCLLAGMALALRVRALLGGRAHPLAEAVGPALVDPRQARTLLAQLREDPDPTLAPLVIGFAETATALGHALRDGFVNADYAHTTREIGACVPLLVFEEEHSHAPAQRLAHLDPRVLDGDRLVVLVDDELTTGRTVLNLIAALHAVHPRSRYVVAALLDWRGQAAREQFATTQKRLGARIDVVALVEGRLESPLRALPAGASGSAQPAVAEPMASAAPATLYTHELPAEAEAEVSARYGWSPADQARLERFVPRVAGVLCDARGGGPALCLGTEEFMYTPLRVAAQLGDEVVYQSTTRSPIAVGSAPGYPIRARLGFTHPHQPGLESQVYNVVPGRYSDVFVFLERGPIPAGRRSLREAFARLGSSTAVHFVSFAGGPV